MGREALAFPQFVLNLGLQVLTGWVLLAKLGWDNWRQTPAHGGIGNLGHGGTITGLNVLTWFSFSLFVWGGGW